MNNNKHYQLLGFFLEERQTSDCYISEKHWLHNELYWSEVKLVAKKKKKNDGFAKQNLTISYIDQYILSSW